LMMTFLVSCLINLTYGGQSYARHGVNHGRMRKVVSKRTMCPRARITLRNARCSGRERLVNAAGATGRDGQAFCLLLFTRTRIDPSH
jgi:hypothetical protein